MSEWGKENTRSGKKEKEIRKKEKEKKCNSTYKFKTKEQVDRERERERERESVCVCVWERVKIKERKKRKRVMVLLNHSWEDTGIHTLAWKSVTLPPRSIRRKRKEKNEDAVKFSRRFNGSKNKRYLCAASLVGREEGNIYWVEKEL